MVSCGPQMFDLLACVCSDHVACFSLEHEGILDCLELIWRGPRMKLHGKAPLPSRRQCQGPLPFCLCWHLTSEISVHSLREEERGVKQRVGQVHHIF